MSRRQRDSGVHPLGQRRDPPGAPVALAWRWPDVQGLGPTPDRTTEEDRVTAVAEPAGEVGPLRVECAVAAVGVVVPPGTSILEAVRRAGLEVPAACADARCGACETRVFEGEPDHRDQILTADERAFGETMMICVSRARTPRLVLDL